MEAIIDKSPPRARPTLYRKNLTFDPTFQSDRRVNFQNRTCVHGEIKMAYDLRTRKVTNYKEVANVEVFKAIYQKKAKGEAL